MADYWELCCMDYLSNDSLIQIFNNLDHRDRLTVEQVCKRWKRVIGYSWSDIRKFPEHVNIRFFSENQLKKILHLCSPYIRVLNLKTNENDFLTIAATGCQQLDTLTFKFHPDNSNESPTLHQLINKILFNNPHLKNLEIDSIPDDFDWHALKNVPWSLQHFTLDSRKPSRCLMDFSQMSELKSLEMKRCIGNGSKLKSLQNLTNLKYLQLFSSPTPFDFWPTVATLQTLTILKLEELRQMTTSDIKLVLVGCINLEELTINGCQCNIDRTVIDSILTLKKIKKLFFDCVEFTYDIGIGRLTTLEELSAGMGCNLRSADCIALVINSPNLTTLWASSTFKDKEFISTVFRILSALPRKDNPLTIFIDSSEESWRDDQNFNESVLIVELNI